MLTTFLSFFLIAAAAVSAHLITHVLSVCCCAALVHPVLSSILSRPLLKTFLLTAAVPLVAIIAILIFTSRRRYSQI